jgi:cytochrome b561
VRANANPWQTLRLSQTIRPPERRLARYSHRIFYVILFAMPISGWLMSSAKNYSVGWSNLPTWPDLIGKREIGFVRLRGLHDTMSFVQLALASVHVLAVFRHHFSLKDDVLQSMLPFGKARRLP